MYTIKMRQRLISIILVIVFTITNIPDVSAGDNLSPSSLFPLLAKYGKSAKESAVLELYLNRIRGLLLSQEDGVSIGLKRALRNKFEEDCKKLGFRLDYDSLKQIEGSVFQMEVVLFDSGKRIIVLFYDREDVPWKILRKYGLNKSDKDMEDIAETGIWIIVSQDGDERGSKGEDGEGVEESGSIITPQEDGPETREEVELGYCKKCRELEDLVNRYRFLSLTEEDLVEDYLTEQKIEYELGPEDAAYLKGKTVMVVGAGGTIGGEMARQLADKEAGRIILVDINENGLYDMRIELDQVYGMAFPQVVCLLGDVRDKNRMESIFSEYKPDVVFHYANYKSLALGNVSPEEFVKVNIGGTRNLLEAACGCGSVERFVYISSDKAANPMSNYGRTKRICELMVQAFAGRNPDIRFGSIRYCNVLDAAGSYAIPEFRDCIINGRQIIARKMRNGEIPSRYFIPRHLTARLDIKVGCECDKGEVFSLDSNRFDALRIDDLIRMIAEKAGIKDVDLWFSENVRYISAEEGEKVGEDLGQGEPVPNSPIIKIMPDGVPEFSLLNGSIDRLLLLCEKGRATERVEKGLKGIVYDFTTDEKGKRIIEKVTGVSGVEAKTWVEENVPGLAGKTVVSLSMEGNIPELNGDAREANVKGGLGVYFGDKLEGLADIGMEAVGIQPMYAERVEQVILDSGGQFINMKPVSYEGQAIEQVLDAEGEPLILEDYAWNEHDINADEKYTARVYRVDRGGSINYLICCPGVFDILYTNDRRHRYTQEILFGKFVYQLLKKVDIKPDVLHLNEAHTVVAAAKIRADSDFENTAIVYTNHTVVPAGLERFRVGETGADINRMFYLLGLDGSVAGDYWDTFTTEEGVVDFCLAALELCDVCNGVSTEHADITRAMFGDYPEEVIGILNGSGRFWKNKALIEMEDSGEEINKERLWEIHEEGKREAFRFIREKLLEKAEFITGGNIDEYMLNDPDKPTVWLVRRMVDYKSQYPLLRYLVDIICADRSEKFNREALLQRWESETIPDMFTQDHLTEEAERQLDRLFDGRDEIHGLGMQVVAGGIAPVGDKDREYWIKEFNRWMNLPSLKGRFVYVPDSDTELLRMQAIGADILLDCPRPFEEACGTSHQRSMMNGGIVAGNLTGGVAESVTDENGFPYGPFLDKDDFYLEAPSQILDRLVKTSQIYYGKRKKWQGLMHNAYMASSKVTARAMEERYAGGVYELAIQRRLEHELKESIMAIVPCENEAAQKVKETKVKVDGVVRGLSDSIRKIRMVVNSRIRWELDFVDALVKNNKYIMLDRSELAKPENAYIRDWIEKMVKGRERSPFIYSDEGVPNGVNPEDVIYLLEPEKVDDQLPEDGRLYLPLPYSVSSIYLASQMVLAGGNVAEIQDNLAKSTIRALYETLLGRKITGEELYELFRTPWTVLPPIVQITGTLNALRKAIAEIEKAA